VHHLREVLSLGEALEMRSFQARCRLALGHAHRSAGRPDEARADLARAAEVFAALGMPSWLERADAARAALR
jgi:hypothetical protein